MAKYASAIPNGLVVLDGESQTPLYRQLYDCLRGAILKGQLAPGTRLQSSREVAGELKVSRNTVVNAYEQLLAEGYLEGQVGSGTYVSRALPEDLLNVRTPTRRCARARGGRTALSKRGRVIAVGRAGGADRVHRGGPLRAARAAHAHALRRAPGRAHRGAER